MSTHTDIGSNIRRAREAAGMTQAELAQQSGIPQNQISRYENGQAEIPAVRLGSISLALRVPIATLDERLLALPMDGHVPGEVPPELCELAAARHQYPIISFAQAAGFDPVHEPLDDLVALSEEVAMFETEGEDLVAVRIEGESMAPMLPHGSVVLVTTQGMPRSGQPTVAKLRETGQVVCKLWYWRHGIIELRSINPEGDNYSWTKEEVQATHPLEWRFPVVEYNVKVKW